MTAAPPLLFGPYHAPALRRGDRATCLYRDADVVVTSWTTAPIPWPRCRALDSQGGSGLLVDEELARAVRCESSLAVQHWWGMSPWAVWCWRKAFGVTQWGTEGSRRLHARCSAAGAEKVRGRRRTDEEEQRRLATRRRNGVRPPRPREGDWTAEELALLGTLPDDVVAARTGRTEAAVRAKRWRRSPGRPDEGARAMRSAADDASLAEDQREAHAEAREQERRRKIAAARRGKPRPPHVIEAMRQGRTGKPQSEETRRKISAASRARGAWPPAAGRPWTPEEDALLTLPTAEAAARTGRSVGAVKCRRAELRRQAGPSCFRTRQGG
jgi:hypothetical protein